MIGPITAIEICRFLHDSVLLLLWGSTAFLAFLTPADIAEKTWRSLSAPALCAAVVNILTVVVSLPLQSAVIGDGWTDALNPGMLAPVLLESSVGSALQAQFAAAVFMLSSFMIWRRHRITLVALTSALSLAVLTLNGHASLHQGWLAAVHRLNDALHLLAGGAWVGALIPLIVILRQLAANDHQASAQIALRRFSTAGHIAVAIVLISGILNTLLVLGHLPTDWTSPYQRLLILKIVAVLVMIGLAMLNRYRFVPAMAVDSSRAIRSIRIGSLLEIATALAIIALVSVFGVLDPT